MNEKFVWICVQASTFKLKSEKNGEIVATITEEILNSDCWKYKNKEFHGLENAKEFVSKDIKIMQSLKAKGLKCGN